MESLRKSFKSHGSHKHTRKISAGGGGEEQKHEELPILLEYDDGVKKSLDSGDTREFSGNNNGNMSQNTGGGSRDVELVLQPDGTKIWRESSYDFWKEDGPVAGDGGNASQSSGAKDGYYFLQRPQGLEDPPSNLIGQFLNKQRAAGEILLDMDLEMDELRHDRSLLPSITENPTTRQVSEREPKVSFQEHPSSNRVEIESVRQWYNESLDEDHPHHQHSRLSANLSGGGGGGGVLRCSSNALFQRTSGLLRIRSKSRLMDPPPEEQDRRSGRVMKSGQLKSGMLGKAEDDEYDPLEEDLPNEFKKANFSTLTVLQWISLILIVAAFVCTISIPVFRSRILWHLHLWKWEVLILVLICGRLVSGWGIRIVVFFIERNFVLRKRVLYFVYGVRKAVQNCLWLGLVLIAWHFMFDKKVEEHTKSGTLVYVTKILVCLLVGTLIWLVKTLLVKVLASSFHVSTFFDRIQESLFNQYVIETLSGPPLIEIQNKQEEEDRVMTEVHRLQNAGATMPADLRATAFPMSKSGTVIGSGGLQRSSLIGKSFKFSGPVSKKQDNGITIEDLHKLNQKNISAWNMKRLMNIVRHGFLSTLDEQILDSTHGDDSAMQIRSEIEAKTAARKIFNNMAKLGSKYIYPEDLMRFVREDEALKTMSLFEGAIESKRISKSALKKWVVNAFRERKALSLTLNDTKTAVNKLHHIVNIIVGGIIVVIWLLILGIATTQFLVVMSSQLLLVAFVFGNTCKTTFEAIIFLFVMHPYDVGDRCEVDGVQMIVEEMNILTTVFLRYDSQKIIYPNSVLSTMPISNYYRSPDMGDAIEFCIHISTPVEKIACMRERIVRYIENKKDHWHPAPTVILKDVEDMNRLKMAVWLTHRMNHQDMGTRWARRALLVEEMLKIFRELNIEYRMLPLDINVQKMPTIASTRLPSNWAACIN